MRVHVAHVHSSVVVLAGHILPLHGGGAVFPGHVGTEVARSLGSEVREHVFRVRIRGDGPVQLVQSVVLGCPILGPVSAADIAAYVYGLTYLREKWSVD